jgi:FixJ family two-component response regulator
MLLPMNKETTVPARASAMTAQGLVCVVDDDESVRESLPDLLRELGYSVQAFASAEEFLTAQAAAATWCLILDIGMPGMTGPELQQELLRRGSDIQVIFITARADDCVRQQLLAQGAAGCLFKPFSEHELRTALDVALQRAE